MSSLLIPAEESVIGLGFVGNAMYQSFLQKNLHHQHLSDLIHSRPKPCNHSRIFCIPVDKPPRTLFLLLSIQNHNQSQASLLLRYQKNHEKQKIKLNKLFFFFRNLLFWIH